MAFCRNCGNQLSDDAVFCANCGTPVAGQSQPQQAPAQPQQAPAQPQQPQQPVNIDADVQQNRGIAWLAYMGLLLLIPLFARKKSEYCQFHVKQGATLLATEIAYLIAKSIILLIIDLPTREVIWGYTIHSGFYNAMAVIFNLGYIFFTVIAIIGIVNAATGKKNEIPLIGKIPFIAMLMDKIYASLNK